MGMPTMGDTGIIASKCL